MKREKKTKGKEKGKKKREYEEKQRKRQKRKKKVWRVTLSLGKGRLWRSVEKYTLYMQPPWWKLTFYYCPSLGRAVIDFGSTCKVKTPGKLKKIYVFFLKKGLFRGITYLVKFWRFCKIEVYISYILIYFLIFLSQ